jgi:VTC domain-containing protein
VIPFEPGVFRPVPGNGRREAKYRLESEGIARAIREYVRPYVVSDPHAADLPGARYSLVSLYLDTPALDFYHDTVHGEKNRHKLRIRCYQKPDSPAFFEVKSRVNDVIRKRRAPVRPEAITPLLEGVVPRRRHLFDARTGRLADLLFFRDLMQLARATPRMRVRYVREPYISKADEGLRITFDRRVACSPTDTSDVRGEGDAWHPACRLPVILEIKFDQLMPGWVGELIRRFNLVRTSIPKYVMSTDTSRKLGIHVSGSGWRVVP